MPPGPGSPCPRNRGGPPYVPSRMNATRVLLLLTLGATPFLTGCTYLATVA